jgi:hypothetical protein
MVYKNLTQHDIVLNDGTVFPPYGIVAQVDETINEKEPDCNIRLFSSKKDCVENLPPELPDVRYIVSGPVFDATDRKDVIRPVTRHPEVIRSEKGFIKSVPGFITKGE